MLVQSELITKSSLQRATPLNQTGVAPKGNLQTYLSLNAESVAQKRPFSSFLI